MDQKFTEALAAWLAKPENERDYKRGAEMLYQLNGNAIMFRNLIAAPEKRADYINHNIQKYYTVRVQAATHEEVEKLRAKAQLIARAYNLDKEQKEESELKAGKRADHDSLPENIQALYVENASIRQRMRDVQTRLRMVTEDVERKFCPDSDMWPFVKELVDLDDKYRKNWQAYDSYERAPIMDARENSKANLRLVNLNKGRFRKKPSDELAAKIREWYGGILNPTEKLTNELVELGIL